MGSKESGAGGQESGRDNFRLRLRFYSTVSLEHVLPTAGVFEDDFDYFADRAGAAGDARGVLGRLPHFVGDLDGTRRIIQKVAEYWKLREKLQEFERDEERRRTGGA